MSPHKLNPLLEIQKNVSLKHRQNYWLGDNCTRPPSLPGKLHMSHDQLYFSHYKKIHLIFFCRVLVDPTQFCEAKFAGNVTNNVTTSQHHPIFFLTENWKRKFVKIIFNVVLQGLYFMVSVMQYRIFISILNTNPLIHMRLMIQIHLSLLAVNHLPC